MAAKILAVAIIAMMGLLGANILMFDGLDHGVGLDTFLAGSGSPWQLFINQDLVAGLWLASAWIAYRQRGARVMETVAWVWMVMWWGNIIVAAYVLVALRQANGDRLGFFVGARAAQLRTAWPVPGFVLKILLVAAAMAALAWMVRLLGIARTDVAVIGALLGFLPIVLSLLLLALPQRGRTIAA